MNLTCILRRSTWPAFVVVLLFAGLLQAASLPEVKPEDVGISSARLNRLTAAFTRAVEAGDIPGAVLMVARNGKLVYQRSIGMQDQAKGIRMALDSIFRLYSMTKPIVSVVAMTLVEEGKLSLEEPISKYIPEFKEMTVGVETFDAAGTSSFHTVPARRQITVHDLLRHTSGLTYGVSIPETQIGKMYKEAKLLESKTIGDACKALAKIPLRNEPGTVWEYGASTDVLGRVVEVASGQPLDQLVSDRLLKPLKMEDTAWDVPLEKQSRIAEPKAADETDLVDPRKKTTLFAGGHGMLSPASDYLRFAQMLVNGGQLDGVRILSRTTVAYMASNHIPPEISKGPNWFLGPGNGFGLGFGVRLETGMLAQMGTPGRFGWSGGTSTTFFVDPKERLAAVLMMQETPDAKGVHSWVIFSNLIYQSIVD